MILQHAPGLFYAPSEIHGLGVFCSHDLAPGDVIEICPVIVLTSDELPPRAHTLYQYYFVWGEQQSRCAIALGYGSLYNHDDMPNADFTPDFSDDTLIITAVTEISAGTEITIDYHAGAVTRENWF